MNELDRYEPAREVAAAPVSALPAAVAALAEWAQQARAAHELATALVETSFVPEAFRGKAHEATAAILAGAEVGLSPMAALKAFDVIQGSSAPRAITLRAIVQSVGHQIWTEESTETRAIVCGQRKGSQKVERSVWTLDRAKKLGLSGKKNWISQPGAMLLARATSECSRLTASDAILGIAYSVEELGDDDQDSTVIGTVPAKRTAKRTARRAPVEPPAPTAPDEPDLEEPAQPEAAQPEPEPAGDMITEPQTKKMGALMRELDLTDREDALTYVAGIVGHEVASRKDLTKTEASMVIDGLEADKGTVNLETGELALDPAEGEAWGT